MEKYRANTDNPSLNVFLDGFFRSALIYPRSSVSSGLMGGKLLEEMKAGRLRMVDLASYPNVLLPNVDGGENPVRRDLVAGILAVHRAAKVPDFAGLEDGGLERGAGLVTSTIISSLLELFKQDGGQQLPDIGKPGWQPGELEWLDGKLQDPAAMAQAEALFDIVESVLRGREAQEAADFYRSNRDLTAGALGIAAVAAAYEGDNPEKYPLFDAASIRLVNTVCPLVRGAFMARADDLAALGISAQAAGTFAHNITRSLPNPAWLPGPPQQ